MPKYYNKIVCVTEPELTVKGDNGEEPVIGREAFHSYKKLCTKKHVPIVVRRGGGPNCPALINWELLRPDIKDRYMKKYKVDPKTAAKPYGLRSLLKPDYDAVEYFAKYTLADGRHLPEETQQLYVANANMLNALLQVSIDRNGLIKALGGSTNGVWPQLAETATLLKAETGHNLQGNPIRLKQEVEAYKQTKYAGLISGKWMNVNAGKVKDTQQQATLRQLLRKHNNLDNEQIRSLYNIVAENMGWKTVDAKTVANYRIKWELDTYSGRKGANAFDNNLAMQVKRSAPALPLYYWTADGWDAELLYQKTFINDKGHSTTTYHNRLCIVVLLDPCCKYPIGYAIGEAENPRLIKEAVRNAVTHTKELFGEYYKVLQLQTDNYGNGALTPIYEVVSDKYTPARAHNAKAKVIEPYFNYLNRSYCQLMPNWSGFGIASGSKKQPNAEYINKIHGSFPDEFGLRHQLSCIMEQERASKIGEYMQLYAKLAPEDKKPMDMPEFLYLLGETTGFTNRLAAPGLMVTIDGEKHAYDSFDIGFRRHGDVEWTVRYNPADTTQVLASNADGTLRYLLAEKYVQPMALRERSEADGAELAKIGQYNKTMRTQITEGMARDYREVDAMFGNNPQLDNTLAKLVLTDSHGQHKDYKSAARLGAQAKAQKVLAKQARQLEAAQERSWAQQQEEYLDSKININNYL